MIVSRTQRGKKQHIRSLLFLCRRGGGIFFSNFSTSRSLDDSKLTRSMMFFSFLLPMNYTFFPDMSFNTHTPLTFSVSVAFYARLSTRFLCRYSLQRSGMLVQMSLERVVVDKSKDFPLSSKTTSIYLIRKINQHFSRFFSCQRPIQQHFSTVCNCKQIKVKIGG